MKILWEKIKSEIDISFFLFEDTNIPAEGTKVYVGLEFKTPKAKLTTIFNIETSEMKFWISRVYIAFCIEEWI